MSRTRMTFNGICSKLTRSTCCGTPLSSTSKSEGPSPRIADPPSLSVTSTSTRTASTFEEKLGCDCDKDTMGTRDKDTMGTRDKDTMGTSDKDTIGNRDKDTNVTHDNEKKEAQH